MNNIPLDPQNNERYEYSVTHDKSEYQIKVELENGEEVSYIDKTYANENVARIDGNYDGWIVTIT